MSLSSDLAGSLKRLDFCNTIHWGERTGLPECFRSQSARFRRAKFHPASIVDLRCPGRFMVGDRFSFLQCGQEAGRAFQKRRLPHRRTLVGGRKVTSSTFLDITDPIVSIVTFGVDATKLTRLLITREIIIRNDGEDGRISRARCRLQLNRRPEMGR